MGMSRRATHPVDEPRNRMSPDPKSPQLPTEAPQTPRRTYATPRLQLLGSVRELTLGSPKGKFSDGTFSMATPPM